MKNASFDLELKNLLIKAVLADYREPLAAPDDNDEIWSLPYRRQREKMLADPRKWARNKAHPLWRRTLQQVACLLLVTALALGTAMTISPTVRAAVINWVREVYETVVEYHFSGPRLESEMPRYHFANLPERYQEITYDDIGDSVTIIYQDSENEGDMIALEYTYMSDGVVIEIDTETGLTTWTLEEFDMDGHPVDCFIPENPKYGIYLSWIDEKANLHFVVSGTVPKESVIELAKSVKKCE